MARAHFINPPFPISDMCRRIRCPQKFLINAGIALFRTLKPVITVSDLNYRVARVISPLGQASSTSFRVLSTNPDTDLSSDAAPAMIVAAGNRNLPWTLDAAWQSIPTRCGCYALS